MYDSYIQLPSVAAIMRKFGLEKRGEIQNLVANEVVRLCDPYVPFDEGYLKESVRIEDGGETVSWNTPYAKYQYYGMLMVAENGSSWAKFGETKQLTDVPLKHQNGRRSFWFDYAMQNGGIEEITQAVRKRVGERGK